MSASTSSTSSNPSLNPQSTSQSEAQDSHLDSEPLDSKYSEISNTTEVDTEKANEVATDDIEADDIEDDGDIEDDEQSNAPSADSLTVSEAYTVDDANAGQRVDKLSAEQFAAHSRGQIQDWIKNGNLTVNGERVKSKHRVKEGDKLVLNAVLEQHGSEEPEDIPLDVIYEDDSVVVINKPVGMVVHPGAGNWSGTLVNGLLYRYPNQAHLPRAGLVHRIDKNTSGLLVVGKTKAAQLDLQEQLKDKSVYRHYQCVVAGDVASLTRQRVIDAPIGRHRVQRTKMTVTSTGKTAVTHIMDITPLNDSYSLLDVRLETGRTHQIRVHLSHIGHPIIGDDVYGNRQQLRAGLTQEQREAIQTFPRQALHAYKLGFIHPETGESMELTAPLPDDIIRLCIALSESDDYDNYAAR